MSDAAQWKRDIFCGRPHACTCRDEIPGVQRGRTSPSCPEHGWEGDPVAEEGRSIIENDAILTEHRDG